MGERERIKRYRELGLGSVTLRCEPSKSAFTRVLTRYGASLEGRRPQSGRASFEGREDAATSG